MTSADPLFACEGEMARLMAARDWASTPLGASEHWPHSLRTSIAILLRSRYPMILTWGEQLVMLYNDAFIPTLGAKHPRALGGLLSEEFAEVWDDVGPMQRSVLAGGPAVWAEDLPLTIERGTGPEQAYFTFSYSHVPDERGPGGVLAVLGMTTDKVVAARRMSVLNALAVVANQATDPDKVALLVMGALGEAVEEIRAATLYRPAEKAPAALRLVRAGMSGPPCDEVLPEELADPDSPVMRAWSDGRPVVHRHTCAEDSQPLLHVALPVRVQGETGAVLVLTPHPLRPYDENHGRFMGLVADQVGQIFAVATERAREQSRLEALAALDAAKSAFLSNVSHEFRTPLTLLLGPLDDVLTGRVDGIDREEVEVMHASAHRLLRMVNGLLDVARIEADGLRATLEPTDIAELTRDLLQPFGAAAGRAGVTLDTRLDLGLGVVQLDPELWEKIVLNLVANAVKFTPEGSVDVRLGRMAGSIVLSVADTGVGIPEDEVDLVFDRFHRVHTSGARNIEGAGIGLSIVAEAVRAMDGTVAVTSHLGSGSTFEVTLPLVAGSGLAAPWTPHVAAGDALARDATSGSSLPAPGLVTTASDEGPSILVAEDNPAMRSRLARILAELGTVTTAPDGRVALDLLRERRFDLVVTDVMMPNLDGLGLLQEIRTDARLRGTTVVVLSARAGAEAAAGGIEAGADDYVVKPFTTGELLARCRTNLELAQYRANEAAGHVRSALLAGVSHDMQTPLAVISSTLELLSEGDVSPESARKVAARARLRTAQLTQLVTQFLDWSRLNANESLPIRVSTVDLRDLADHVASDYDRVLVSGASGLAAVTCDRQRTEQILHNLVDNAERSARTSVEIRIEEGEDVVLARVVDDGPGVGAEILPRLFEAFGPSADQLGNGLGLHISREAARAQGGDLVLESTGPDGCVFTLSVPKDRP